MASSSKQRNVGLKTVKTEPFDLIWISSDDEGANGSKRVAKSVDQGRDTNVAKRVHKRVAKSVDPNKMKEVCEWITPVTQAMQRLNRKQTLHIPSWVVKHALLGKSEIYMKSAETKRMFDCEILNPGRSLLQRYIGDGWYDYVDLHKPKVGDILHFELKPPYDLIVVSLMRNKAHSR